MTTNTCTCDSIIQGSGGQTATYRILGVLCPTCESLSAAVEAAINEVHPAKSGKVTIHLREAHPYFAPPKRFQVYALDGHETLPATRSFDDEASARRYANVLWRNY